MNNQLFPEEPVPSITQDDIERVSQWLQGLGLEPPKKRYVLRPLPKAYLKAILTRSEQPKPRKKLLPLPKVLCKKPKQEIEPKKPKQEIVPKKPKQEIEPKESTQETDSTTSELGEYSEIWESDDSFSSSDEFSPESHAEMRDKAFFRELLSGCKGIYRSDDGALCLTF